MNQQPKALDMAHRLATRKVTNWVHATGDTPRSSGFCSDQECVEAAALLRTQHAELEALRASIRTQRAVIDDQQTELDRKSDAIQRLWAERDQLRKEVERLREDAARLDWLESQRMAYGFQGIHEGNEWKIDGPYATVREAIDDAREAKG